MMALAGAATAVVFLLALWWGTATPRRPLSRYVFGPWINRSRHRELMRELRREAED
jgi:hypothetical protein